MPQRVEGVGKRGLVFCHVDFSPAAPMFLEACFLEVLCTQVFCCWGIPGRAEARRSTRPSSCRTSWRRATKPVNWATTNEKPRCSTRSCVDADAGDTLSLAWAPRSGGQGREEETDRPSDRTLRLSERPKNRGRRVGGRWRGEGRRKPMREEADKTRITRAYTTSSDS